MRFPLSVEACQSKDVKAIDFQENRGCLAQNPRNYQLEDVRRTLKFHHRFRI